MRVAVMGTGYVGLTTGAGLAALGHDVTCVDVDAEKIALLQRGELPFFEPGLSDLVLRSTHEGRLSFSTDSPTAMRDAQVVFCAVGTPPSADGSADLSFVQAVASTFAQFAPREALLVIKSTVPPGTTRRLALQIGRSVASNPEFLREGSAVQDALEPDRVVLGVDVPQDRALLEALYQPLVSRGVHVFVTTPTSAELVKYTSNAMLAMRISFANEIANLCEAVGASADDVLAGAGLDHRIGPAFLRAGVGYGGSCFPKDVRALVAAGAAAGYHFTLLPKVEEVNRLQRERWYQKLVVGCGGSVAGKTIAVWGLAFKPNTDDVREAPALYFLERLLNEGATVRAFDPVAMEPARRYFPSVTYAASPLDAAQDADAVVVLTEWPVFGTFSRAQILNVMRGDVLLDGRGVLRPAD